MTRSNADLLALKAELTNDPLDLELTLEAADDEANAGKLNLVRQTITVKRRSLTTAALFNAISPLEHQALSPEQERWLGGVLSLNQIDPFAQSQTMGGLTGPDGLFGDDSDSKVSITAAISRSGSRIEQLFQLGIVEDGSDLSPSDISQARNAT